MDSAGRSATVRAQAARRPHFDAHRCKRCGVCAAVCPTAAIALSASEGAGLARPEECTGCATCELICPDFAVWVSRETPAGSNGSTVQAPGERVTVGDPERREGGD